MADGPDAAGPAVLTTEGVGDVLAGLEVGALGEADSVEGVVDAVVVGAVATVKAISPAMGCESALTIW